MKTGRFITDYFASTARDNPNSAIRWGKGNTLSWEALYLRAKRLAHHLIYEWELRRGECVAIGLERSPEFLVAAYAVLLAGGVYFPVDAKTPVARLSSMFATARCRLAFCATDKVNLFSHIDDKLVLIQRDQLEEITTQLSSDSPLNLPQLQATDPAYLIFTSGTTGTPKGVLVNHGAFINRLEWHQRHSELVDTDIILQRTALMFDVSLWELFLPALNGASHYLLQPGLESYPRAIVAALAGENITVVHFVPSLLKPVLQELKNSDMPDGLESDPPLADLHQVYVSGESLPAGHAPNS
ncbi:AMP-binding protein [Xenorhabdus sp. SF857]|uniref:AMP-binding protein n=1 Tax=Xenorhabdus bakwenae TaxID=3026967 RepID=UPI00255822FB|nr:AMP-binding protein [Xenorhabdus sp. SF857]WFQ80642.1 AMP-binding protein [Xenorhabdus sp. SF857]